jgi:hypothetical protein
MYTEADIALISAIATAVTMFVFLAAVFLEGTTFSSNETDEEIEAFARALDKEQEDFIRAFDEDEARYIREMERFQNEVDPFAESVFTLANRFDAFARRKVQNIAKTMRPAIRPIPKNELPSMRGGYVYIIRDTDVTGYCKIGKTNNPQRRIGHFDTMLPFSTEVLCILETDNCSFLEYSLHRQYASKRVRGEWFALDDDDIAAIRRLA